jgi:hypothetical protein
MKFHTSWHAVNISASCSGLLFLSFLWVYLKSKLLYLIIVMWPRKVIFYKYQGKPFLSDLMQFSNSFNEPAVYSDNIVASVILLVSML